MGSTCPTLESEVQLLQPVECGRVSAVWFLRVGHKRSCSFYLVLLEHLLSDVFHGYTTS